MLWKFLCFGLFASLCSCSRKLTTTDKDEIAQLVKPRETPTGVVYILAPDRRHLVLDRFVLVETDFVANVAAHRLLLSMIFDALVQCKNDLMHLCHPRNKTLQKKYFLGVLTTYKSCYHLSDLAFYLYMNKATCLDRYIEAFVLAATALFSRVREFIHIWFLPFLSGHEFHAIDLMRRSLDELMRNPTVSFLESFRKNVVIMNSFVSNSITYLKSIDVRNAVSLLELMQDMICLGMNYLDMVYTKSLEAQNQGKALDPNLGDTVDSFVVLQYYRLQDFLLTDMDRFEAMSMDSIIELILELKATMAGLVDKRVPTAPLIIKFLLADESFCSRYPHMHKILLGGTEIGNFLGKSGTDSRSPSPKKAKGGKKKGRKGRGSPVTVSLPTEAHRSFKAIEIPDDYEPHDVIKTTESISLDLRDIDYGKLIIGEYIRATYLVPYLESIGLDSYSDDFSWDSVLESSKGKLKLLRSHGILSITHLAKCIEWVRMRNDLVHPELTESAETLHFDVETISMSLNWNAYEKLSKLLMNLGINRDDNAASNTPIPRFGRPRGLAKANKVEQTWASVRLYEFLRRRVLQPICDQLGVRPIRRNFPLIHQSFDALRIAGFKLPDVLAVTTVLGSFRNELVHSHVNYQMAEYYAKVVFLDHPDYEPFLKHLFNSF